MLIRVPSKSQSRGKLEKRSYIHFPPYRECLGCSEGKKNDDFSFCRHKKKGLGVRVEQTKRVRLEQTKRVRVEQTKLGGDEQLRVEPRDPLR